MKIMENVKNTINRATDNVYEASMIRDIISKINQMNKVSRMKATIGIFGKSGEGKSSLLNAVLGEKDLLPSGCFGACTAVVTRVEANLEDSNYIAEIELFSKEEWEKELEDLFIVLSDESEDRDDDLFDIAVEKITALFGDDAEKKTLEELKKDDKLAEIETLLSTSKKISRSDVSEFTDVVASYIQHSESSQGDWYWPLVKSVTIKIPGCHELLKHIVLVDIPGTGDCKIPKLQDDLRILSKDITRELTRDYFNKAKGVLSLIQCVKLDKGKETVKMKDKVCMEFKESLMKALNELDSRFNTIYSVLKRCLLKGVEKSVKLCVASTEAMIETNNGRGFHKTLGALCRNGGCYFSKSRNELLDLNEALAGNLHECLEEDFNQIFPVSGQTGKSVQEQIDKFSIIQRDSAYFRSSTLNHIQKFIKTESVSHYRNIEYLHRNRPSIVAVNDNGVAEDERP
ncbi:Nuclear GTPase SLIP-GC [Anabarilius grahami]|uniref:Nuclear GTPase SLIP-GC n=1 Tax=Anabarilius grahami TaxID=495550 RepID=A0A3N0XND7_ANAGA|nr:Nuclear GTPase SLIP-GC [Anabarilius grahami]